MHISERLTSKNALNYLKQYDIIVDGTDNFATRYLINDAALLLINQLSMVLFISLKDRFLFLTINNGPSYRCLFPNPPKEGSVANCSEVGVLGVLPGIIGSMRPTKS